MDCQPSVDGLYPGNTVIRHNHKTVLKSSRCYGPSQNLSLLCPNSRLTIIQSFPDSTAVHLYFLLNHHLKPSRSSQQTLRWHPISFGVLTMLVRPFSSGLLASLCPQLLLLPPSFIPFLRHWIPCYILSVNYKFLIVLYYHTLHHFPFSCSLPPPSPPISTHPWSLPLPLLPSLQPPSGSPAKISS